MKFRLLLLLLALTISFSACGGKKKTISSPKNENLEKKETTQKDKTQSETIKTDGAEKVVITVNKTTKEYVTSYADIAMKKMREHNIPASITLAQGVLESSSGNSQLTRQSNNHFGIKCHKDWAGEKVYWDDDAKGECFRVYDKPEGSFEDHSQFLITRSRYASLFDLEPGDYVGWAYGLKAAGYATDKSYPQKLIGIIEKYELYKYDEMVLGKPARLTTLETDGYYTVQKGDGLYSIAKKNNMTLDELKSANNLTSNDITVGQKLKVTKEIKEKNVKNPPEKEKTEVKKVENSIPKVVEQDTIPPLETLYHTVQKGEGLYSISKKYGKTVQEIKDLNHLTSDDIIEGQKLLVSKPAEVETVEPQNIIEKVMEQKKDTITDTKSTQHIVQKGETLYQIAYKYELEIPFLREINHLKTDDVTEGQIIVLTKNIQTLSGKTHTVQKGDTLFFISRLYNIPVDTLIQLNEIENNNIFIGQVLKLE